MRQKLTTCICCCLIAGANLLEAATITGTFTYTKRAPQASVIYIESDKAVEPSAITIDQKNKEFSKKVVIAPKGSKITFDNSDTVQHNIYVDDSAAGASYDSNLSDPGNSIDMPIDWKEDTFVSVGCKIHPKMRVWVGNVATEQFSVAEFAKGELEKEVILENVAAEPQTVKVWIPRFDSAVVDIAPGDTKEVDLTRKGKSFGTLSLSFK